MSTQVPNYALYGHQAQPRWLDMVHFERIHERSSMHNFKIAPHLHDGLVQVLYLTQGGGEVFIDGTHWRVAAPGLIVVPAGHVHGFDFQPEIDGPVVTAAQRPLESWASVGAPLVLPLLRRPTVRSVGLVPRHSEALLLLFEALERENRLHTDGQASAGTALLAALFVHIARMLALVELDAPGRADGSEADAAGRSRKAGQVEQFRTLVDAHFRERWGMERYAAELNLSAGQLSRVCRELLGQSALDLVNARILQEAERELVYSTLAIKQIAELLGFADEAYFGRFFKKHTQRTPSEFRDAALRQLDLHHSAA